MLTLIIIIGIVFVLFSKNSRASSFEGAYYSPYRDLLLISGSGFGATQGASTVSVNGTSLGSATSWNSDSIYYSAPPNNSGNIVVNVSGGSIHSGQIARVSSYASYPSDTDQTDSNLVSYFPFDTNFNDVKGSNHLSSQNLKLYGSGQFGGKYEAIQTFSDPSADWVIGTANYRSIVEVDNQLLIMFNDGVWKYTISSDEGATWSTPIARPAYGYFGFPTEMENGEWLYIQTPTFPTATFTPCHATGVTISNIWSPSSLICLNPVSITVGEVYNQWQYEYLGNGKIIWPMYHYFGPFGAAMIASEDYGHTWESKPISSARVVSGLSLASPIIAGDTQVTITDASGLTDSGFIKFTNGATVETVSYGYKTGNTLYNIRKGNGGQYLVASELNAQSPGTTNSFVVAGTTVMQNAATPGEPSVVADPDDSNHLIMLERHEGGGGSYILKSESTDFGDTWSTFKIIYLDSYATGAPVRGNNFWAYWTPNAGGAQGRIYIFARHWEGTRYFYSDDGGETWNGNNTQTSTKTEDNYTMRKGETWLLANEMNNVIEASDGSGLWLYWAIAIDDASAPGTGTDRGALGKYFFSYADSTTGKNLGYAFSPYDASYNLSEYSIDFWANIRQTHRNIDGTILSRMASDGLAANYDIKIIGNGANQNKIQFRQYNDLTSSWNTITSTSAFSDDQWYHVATTYDGAKIRLYINGVLELSADSTSTHSGNEKLQVGYDQGNDQLLYRGQLDNLKIWNRALSSFEVLARSNWALPTITSVSPTACYGSGENVTITGSGFGATQGLNYLTIGGVIAAVAYWSDTQIIVTLPSSLTAGSQSVIANVSGYASNSLTVSVQSCSTNDFAGASDAVATSAKKKKYSSAITDIVNNVLVGADADGGKTADEPTEEKSESIWWYLLIPLWILIVLAALRINEKEKDLKVLPDIL